MTSEPYIDQAALARAMGVSLRTVQTWTAQGLPYESWGLRVRRYRLSVAIEWARTRQPQSSPALEAAQGEGSPATAGGAAKRSSASPRTPGARSGSGTVHGATGVAGNDRRPQPIRGAVPQ